jgi:ABC-type polysaccharide/polyol phosphate export permease
VLEVDHGIDTLELMVTRPILLIEFERKAEFTSPSRAQLNSRKQSGNMPRNDKPLKQLFLLLNLLIRRELKVKYRGTALGYLWSMLNPFLFMLIIWAVFRGIVKDVPSYHLYVLSGIVTWNSISGSIHQGAHSIVNNGNLLRKVSVPAYLFSLVPVGSCIVNFCLALIPFAIVGAISGLSLHSSLVYLPVLITLLIVFLFGLSLALGSLNVFFRDVGHVLEPIMTISFYATPVIFDRSSKSFSPKLASLLNLNPFTHFVEAFRFVLLGKGHLEIKDLMLLVLLSLSSLLVGVLIYRKLYSRIIYNL